MPVIAPPYDDKYKLEFKVRGVCRASANKVTGRLVTRSNVGSMTAATPFGTFGISVPLAAVGKWVDPPPRRIMRIAVVFGGSYGYTVGALRSIAIGAGRIGYFVWEHRNGRSRLVHRQHHEIWNLVHFNNNVSTSIRNAALAMNSQMPIRIGSEYMIAAWSLQFSMAYKGNMANGPASWASGSMDLTARMLRVTFV